MAEFVQQSIEEMIPELEQMERVGLFTGKETRAILRKRKALEYKLRRRTKQKEDYLQYIQYELSVLALVRKRRQNTGYTFKRIEIDIAIVQRIHRLFKLAQYRFQNDYKLWLSHIEFSKLRMEKSTVSRLFTRMLQVHNHQPGLWIMAAKWEMEVHAAMDTARSLLQRGLRFNPKSKQLWQEYFRMELLNADKLRKRRTILGLAGMDQDEAPDAILEGAVAIVVCKKAFETFPDDVKFWLSFLPISRLFDFTSSIEEEIFKNLQSSHPEKELTWDAVARRCLQGAASDQEGNSLSKKEKALAVKAAEEECWKVFDEAVQARSTEQMWTLYLEACMERLHLKAHRKAADERVQRTLGVFNRAAEKHLVAEAVFAQWVDILLNTGQVQEADRVLKLGTETYPKSARLWILRVSNTIQWGPSTDNIMNLIDCALKLVSDKESLPIWKLALDWCILNKPDAVENLLESGLTCCREVCIFVKEQCLEWALIEYDIKRVRTVYDRLASSKPLSIEFYRKYISIENAQASPKMKKLRKAYEDALRDYGSEHTELWLEYVQLELTHPKGQPENAGKLHWRAMKALDGQLTERFISQYTLMQTGHL